MLIFCSCRGHTADTNMKGLSSISMTLRRFVKRYASHAARPRGAIPSFSAPQSGQGLGGSRSFDTSLRLNSIVSQELHISWPLKWVTWRLAPNNNVEQQIGKRDVQKGELKKNSISLGTYSSLFQLNILVVVSSY